MFELKNAIKNIYRYKNKYIMFGVLYLILISAASVCVNIFIQAEQITDNILREYTSVSKLSAGISQSTFARGERLPDRPTKEEFLALINEETIDDIKFFRYNFDTSFLREDTNELEMELHVSENIKPAHISPWSPVIVSGYNLSLLHFATNDFNLERGRMFENDSEAVIVKNPKYIPRSTSKWDEDTEAWIDEWREIPDPWNDLDLGDTIIIRKGDGFHKEFKVVGIQAGSVSDDEMVNRRIIYTTLESAEYFDVIASLEGGRSHIMAPLNITESNPFNENMLILIGYDIFVYTDSPERFLELQRQLRWNVEINEWTFSVNPMVMGYNSIMNLTRSMQEMSRGFGVLSAFIIICVTIVATIILLNNRKYEIAVLRSVGMKKSRLIINYLIENFVFIWGVSFTAIIVAQFFTPMFISGAVEGIRHLVAPEMFENITQNTNIGLLLQNTGLVLAGTTIVVMLSLILACINILRFEPLKIFNKRH